MKTPGVGQRQAATRSGLDAFLLVFYSSSESTTKTLCMEWHFRLALLAAVILLTGCQTSGERAMQDALDHNKRYPGNNAVIAHY